MEGESGEQVGGENNASPVSSLLGKLTGDFVQCPEVTVLLTAHYKLTILHYTTLSIYVKSPAYGDVYKCRSNSAYLHEVASDERGTACTSGLAVDVDLLLSRSMIQQKPHTDDKFLLRRRCNHVRRTQNQTRDPQLCPLLPPQYRSSSQTRRVSYTADRSRVSMWPPL